MRGKHFTHAAASQMLPKLVTAGYDLELPRLALRLGRHLQLQCLMPQRISATKHHAPVWAITVSSLLKPEQVPGVPH
jgi:hypothetical protein